MCAAVVRNVDEETAGFISTISASFVQEDEEAYHQNFPDHRLEFADLESLDGEMEPDLDTQQQQMEEQKAAHALVGDIKAKVIGRLVAAYGILFENAEGSTAQTPSEFLQSYKAGQELFEKMALLPSQLDVLTLGGHTVALAEHHAGLTRHASADPALEHFNIQRPCPEEALLVREPLQAMETRLLQLLQEWPEHVLLTQLLQICRRITSLGVHDPLKRIMTGIELLLSRAQQWEVGAAKHVSLDKELTVLISLVGRWRKFELAGWRSLIDSVKQNLTNPANQVLSVHLHCVVSIDASVCLQWSSPVMNCLVLDAQFWFVLYGLVFAYHSIHEGSKLPATHFLLELEQCVEV